MQTLQDQPRPQAHPCPGLLLPVPPSPASLSPGETDPGVRAPRLSSQPTKKTQQSTSLHRNGITLAKQILQQLIPGSSTESGFGQCEGMQQIWLLRQKYFETVSDKFSLRDFIAQNGGKRCWGMGTTMLQSPWKGSLQENWGRSGERPGNRTGAATSSLPAQRELVQRGSAHEALPTELCCQWSCVAGRALLLTERHSPVSPCATARLHMPWGRSVPELPGSTRWRFPSTGSMLCASGKSPAPQLPCGARAG